MYTVTIKGFETEWQAKEFVYWYEGSAEQNMSDHLGIIDNNPEPCTSSMDCDLQKTYDKGKLRVVNNNVDLYLKISYESESMLE